MQIWTTAQLIADGYTHERIARLRATGDLTRLSHGHYATGRAANPDELHLLQILALWPSLPADSVLSHESAAVLHGLPLPPGEIGPVRTIRTRRPDGGGRLSPNIRCLRTRLPEHHTTTLEVGANVLRATTVARTVAELALGSLPWGMAAGDAALQRGTITRDALSRVIDELGRRKGIARARALPPMLNADAESAAESLSRFFIEAAGLPTPEVQVWLGNQDRRLARVDFGWTKYRVAGECDGFGKYLKSPAGSPQEALRREKRRDADIVDLGWTPVHWTFSEIFDGRMVRRLARALIRNGWDGRS